MRLFVFGTGRCGSVAIARAFKSATNFTVGNETVSHGLDYPDQHIEVNPQFRVVADVLVRKYPDAWYCLLDRDLVKVARSYARLKQGKWLDRWWEFNHTVRPEDREEAAWIATCHLARQCEWAWHHCQTAKKTRIDIDNVEQRFRRLWFNIGAEGNLAEAMVSFDYPINTSEQRGDL